MQCMRCGLQTDALKHILILFAHARETELIMLRSRVYFSEAVSLPDGEVIDNS